jgi:type I restriction enzyme S subunit
VKKSLLPANWEDWPLSDIGEWFGGGTPSKSKKSYWDGTIPWVSPKDMKAPVIFDTEDHISSESVDNSAVKIIPAGAVIFVTRSGILAHSFPVATTEVEVTINQDIKGISPLSVIDSAYLAWCLRAQARSILHTCSKDGTTVHSIEISSLKSHRVPIPPIDEQRNIVAKLEELFSELDKGIESLKTAREQLKVYRQAVLKRAFDGKMTTDWRSRETRLMSPSELKQWFAIERAGIWKAPGKSYHRGNYELPVGYDDKDLPSVPGEWALMSMDECCEHITSGSRGWSKYYGRGASVFVMAQNVKSGKYAREITQYIDAPRDTPEALRTRIDTDDLLVTIVGANTGDVCRFGDEQGDHYVCQSVALMRLIRPEYARFLELYFLASSGGKRQFDRYIVSDRKLAFFGAVYSLRQ